MTATKIQPVAEICSASHDDAQFGERAIKPLRDISGFEYGTPLYAGAAPAAVAGPVLDVRAIAAAVCQRVAELPDRNSPEDWPEAMLVTGQELIDVVTCELEQAQAAPALEAPAALPVPADEFRGDTPSLVRNIVALLELDAEGALVPHRVGGHARGLLSAAAARLAAAPQAPAAPSGLPSGWVPCILTHDGQHHEEVAYGPQIMMDRLKKWLGRYFELLAQKVLAEPVQAEMLAALQAVAMDLVHVGAGENTITDAARAKVEAVLEKIGAPWPSPEAAPAAPAVDAPVKVLSQAARDVLAERRRQVEAEGYEPEADEMYQSGELARAAATYALLATGDEGWRVEDNWPWGMSTLKRAEPRRMLEKAGALILADMERLDRAAAQAAAKGEP